MEKCKDENSNSFDQARGHAARVESCASWHWWEWLVGLSDRKAETVQKSHFALDTFELHARVAFHIGPNIELHLLYHLRNILCFFGGWSSAWNFENQRSKSCCPTVHPRHATGPAQETQASVDWVLRRRVKLLRSEIPGDSQWSMLEDNYSFCWVSLSQGNTMPNGPFQSIDFHQSRSSSLQATMQKHQRKHFWKWWDWRRVLPVIASARGV